MTLREAIGYLRDVPLVGMNRVLAGAAARGYSPGDPAWINLGQGQPETGDLPGAPARITTITLDPDDHAYGPANGMLALREAVASYYNRTYRSDRLSRYTADNVAIVAGGRLGLSRAVAALGHIDVGYLVPDYSAYDDILGLNAPRITPIGLDGYHSGTAGILAAVAATGTRALLLSNPRNPTGEVIRGDDLRALVAGTREAGCALLVDEFYSHYIYQPDGTGRFGPAAGPVSAAEHVEDVDQDAVLLFDGLTKNFRYPGWRLGWIVGPAGTIETIGRVGLHLDGGPSRIVQRAALEALQPSTMEQEGRAVRAAFVAKRNLAVAGLRGAGIRMDAEPHGTFYVWGSLAGLPASLRDAEDFFAAALDVRVITVPGNAFDLNPSQYLNPSQHLDPAQRRGSGGALGGYVRFSYGPAYPAVSAGIDRLAEMIRRRS